MYNNICNSLNMKISNNNNKSPNSNKYKMLYLKEFPKIFKIILWFLIIIRVLPAINSIN